MSNKVSEPQKPMTKPRNDRREHPRFVSDAYAFVKTEESQRKYRIENLSVGGALLSGGPALPLGALVRVTLHVPLYPPIRVMARAVHVDDASDGAVGIAFRHENDVSEDHIQSALLSELERARSL